MSDQESGLPPRKKGRFVKKKVLEAELKRTKAVLEARVRRAKEKSDVEAAQAAEEAAYVNSVCKGRRIIDMQELGKNLVCCQCKAILSLRNIVSERRLGVHSILTVSCGECQIRTLVHTGKMRVINGHEYAESNLNLVKGAIQSGIGYNGVKKVLAAMEIPEISYTLYKRYEQVIREISENNKNNVHNEDIEIIGNIENIENIENIGNIENNENNANDSCEKVTENQEVA